MILLSRNDKSSPETEEQNAEECQQIAQNIAQEETGCEIES